MDVTSAASPSSCCETSFSWQWMQRAPPEALNNIPLVVLWPGWSHRGCFHTKFTVTITQQTNSRKEMELKASWQSVYGFLKKR